MEIEFRSNPPARGSESGVHACRRLARPHLSAGVATTEWYWRKGEEDEDETRGRGRRRSKTKEGRRRWRQENLGRMRGVLRDGGERGGRQRQAGIERDPMMLRSEALRWRVHRALYPSLRASSSVRSASPLPTPSPTLSSPTPSLSQDYLIPSTNK